jgi:hypothetical protein
MMTGRTAPVQKCTPPIEIRETTAAKGSVADSQPPAIEFVDRFSADETGLGSGLHYFRFINWWLPRFRY